MINAIHHLGRIDTPILIFGGPYSNLTATKAMLNLADQQGFNRQQIICTGDVVAYGAEPEQTCQHIIHSGIHIIQGNCEESLANNYDNCGCGFTTGTICSTLSEKWYQYANSKISDSSRTWMSALPRAIAFDIKDYSCRIIHGGVKQNNLFIFPSTTTSKKAEEMEKAGKCDLIICGHSGIPFGQTIGRGHGSMPG